MTKKVNENFFDAESKTGDELKKMWYVVGISYNNYSQRLVGYGKANREITVHLINGWQSNSKPLIEIVKSCLDSEHTISPTKYKHIRKEGEYFITYYLRICNQKLYNSLKERGLNLPKTERRFPKNIDEQYLDHFVRGFFDAQVSCSNQIRKQKNWVANYPLLRIYYDNIPFLQDLYSALVEYAGIRGGREVIKPPLVLRGLDVIVVHNYIYRDWDFIQEHGLYLPNKKELFKTDYQPSDLSIDHPNQIAASQRIERAKLLLHEVESVNKVAELLGYSHQPAFTRAFKKQTGINPTKFIKKGA